MTPNQLGFSIPKCLFVPNFVLSSDFEQLRQNLAFNLKTDKREMVPDQSANLLNRSGLEPGFGEPCYLVSCTVFRFQSRNIGREMYILK